MPDKPGPDAARPDDEVFRQIVRHTPLVSIDLIVRDCRGRALLGLRANEPARAFWFVCGGRILKGEAIREAFARIMGNELGYACAFTAARPRGVYEHLYETNRFDEPGFGTHYIVLAYEIVVPDELEPRPDAQHHELKWWRVPDLLASLEVHPYTKAYFGV
jgi:colanic acid biosynthesis protein WcaH